mmetsp:Transcript_57734/g.153932  ORF Transcript_57734/g.153932 Transcript_57734/m.153932 type:complete len:87 (+) Transcript_57734:500-760(+)
MGGRSALPGPVEIWQERRCWCLHHCEGRHENGSLAGGQTHHVGHGRACLEVKRATGPGTGCRRSAEFPSVSKKVLADQPERVHFLV